ncbi:SH3 domain-containing protein [Streptomyces sp. S186]|uniref:SH3 domain-containing protein n=1 Tax=Streptomyces sp. S186 TaxID=3434395 RepID=UPI003F66EBB9
MAAPIEKAAVARASASCYVYNAANGTVNIRSGPGSQFGVIGTLAKGSRLPCGTLQDGSVTGSHYSTCGGGSDWSTVRIGGRDGWVASECVGFGAG